MLQPESNYSFVYRRETFDFGMFVFTAGLRIPPLKFLTALFCNRD